MSPPGVRVEEEYSEGVKISRLGSPLLSKLSPLLGGKKGRSVKTRELKACKITKVNFFKKFFFDVYIIYVHNDSIVCQANYIYTLFFFHDSRKFLMFFSHDSQKLYGIHTPSMMHYSVWE